ncbi:nucleotidyltransferase family protein [Devosia sp. MC521]|uniref:nucleotidyltransferase family protein n=1 Tax=Devosia sp. MC521 TaxID=2759954 RepID=UPI0015FC2FA8|nr:nucleotidyltransferase family protein [Devosia sp. MC521]MBJ6987104.1 nucleotidyltransferase family protein [Devosia sp. MC521]QMW62723.1 nucleotidyltransferase family protein [Devosia sp. MC521]
MEKPARFPDVMLLAAGLGTRLRPITETIPKPLVPVAGIPLIERVIGTARAEGAKRFAANAHYRADQVLAHFGGLLKVNREDTLLGTGGGVKAALPMLHSDPFFVMNTDAFWPEGADTPLARMQAKRENEDQIVLLCVQPSRASGFSRSHDFCLDPFGRITLDYGAPVIYAGVALLGKNLFADTPDGEFSLNLLFERALDEENLLGVTLDAPWFHVGDAEGLAAAEKALSA